MSDKNQTNVSNANQSSTSYEDLELRSSRAFHQPTYQSIKEIAPPPGFKKPPVSID